VLHASVGVFLGWRNGRLVKWRWGGLGWWVYVVVEQDETKHGEEDVRFDQLI
jgi:hypothetical protein